ncbi:MAG: hypothetical protein MAG431_00408 [Chloroflexi bacterium]|nr:hypothetical protein [Chloroflexota bacterium]
MSELTQGLQISVMGILITFASLGVLILVMVLLRELFAIKPDNSIKSEDTKVEPVSNREKLRMRAAGIAVLAASRRRGTKRTAQLGALLESSSGRNKTQRR